jgi:F-type H+-transporting ATPase subunit alpha
VEREVVSVWAGTTGQLDDVPLADVSRFEIEFLDYLQRERSGIYDTLRETRALSDDTVTALKDAIADFRRGFETGGGELLVTDDEPPAGEAEIQQEGVARRKPAPPETDGSPLV